MDKNAFIEQFLNGCKQDKNKRSIASNIYVRVMKRKNLKDFDWLHAICASIVDYFHDLIKNKNPFDESRASQIKCS
jgi:hypothetical protein